MLHVFNTIGPIFVIILLGWFLRRRGFFSFQLISPLNRLVYYLAIPAMIFREVARAHFDAQFQPLVLAMSLLAVVLIFGVALAAGFLLSVPRPERGTFLQSSFHGNFGYVGLAVAYYYLGRDGFTQASILSAFLMILQNFLSVFALQIFSVRGKGSLGLQYFMKKIICNPVVVSSLAGIAFSMLRVSIPEPADRVLGILSGMALPLALLVIGASLSFRLIQSHLRRALAAGALKLIVTPAVGLGLYLWSGLPSPEFLPGLILLACPTATTAYVMAGEMEGSTDLASAAISLNTLLSALTFVFWLGFWH